MWGSVLGVWDLRRVCRVYGFFRGLEAYCSKRRPNCTGTLSWSSIQKIVFEKRTVFKGSYVFGCLGLGLGKKQSVPLTGTVWRKPGSEFRWSKGSIHNLAFPF